MRYVRVEVDGTPRVGVLAGSPVDGEAVAREVAGGGTIQLLPEGTDLLTAAMARTAPEPGSPEVPAAGAGLLLPVQPVSFRDFVAFEEHVQGMVGMTADPAAALAAWQVQPTYLYGSPHAAVGPDEPVAAPPGSQALDFELEVGVVLGGDGRDLTPAEAHDLIAGYVIVNDWSARDVQRHEMKGGLGPAKAKDFATSIGPWLVTPDELDSARIGDRLDLRMSVAINGVEIGSDSLAHMGWTFEELVAFASRGAWVRAGDVIASGTCEGGSLAEAWGRAGRQEPPPLQPGDVVTLTVDRLGSLTTPVVAAAPERAPITPPRPLADLHAATGTHR